MGKAAKTEKFLWLLTILFLLLLLFVFFDHQQKDTSGGSYSVETERETDWNMEIHRVNINTADLEELQSLHGIGEVLAQRIVERREMVGPYHSVEELLEVEGIGPAKLEGLRRQVTVEEEK